MTLLRHFRALGRMSMFRGQRFRHGLLVVLMIYFLITQVIFLQSWYESPKIPTAKDTHTANNNKLLIRDLGGRIWGRVTSFIWGDVISDAEPLYVIIISYQRTGSSFLGNLFNLHPEAYYAFEPLDGVYVSMYGTAPGFNIPTDITTNMDGSKRYQPDIEVNVTGEVIDRLLTCRHGNESLPLEIRVNDFWNGFSGDHVALQSGFLQCLRNHSATSMDLNCRREMTALNRMCGQWVGRSSAGMRKCQQSLWPPEVRTGQTQGVVENYLNCLNNKIKPVAEKCVPHMTDVCERSNIRAMKVVRPAMSAMPELLRRHGDNLKVIHLFRKPLAVATSRMKYVSVRGHASSVKNRNRKQQLTDDTTIVKEAKFYCRDAVGDLKLRQKLEEEYPNSFKQVLYEDFMKDKVSAVTDIYDFLGEEVPPRVMDYFANSTFKPDKASGWNTPAGASKQGLEQQIEAECTELYQLLGLNT